MDMGIKGRKAIVCAASKGLGKGCAMALAQEGVDLVITAAHRGRARGDGGGDPQEDRREGDADRRRHHDRRRPQAGARRLPEPDILVNNAGGPPPGDFRDWDRDDWIKAIDANMLTPIELIKASVDGMIARSFGRIVNITSSAVKAPIDILGLSQRRAQRPHRLRRRHCAQTVRHNVTINSLLPGPFDTDRLRGTYRRAPPRAARVRARSSRGRRQDDPGRPLRHDRGVRRRLRLPVQRARELHHRPEPADRRRAVSGDVLIFGARTSRSAS